MLDRRSALGGLVCAPLMLGACSGDPEPTPQPIQRKAPLPKPEIIPAETALTFDYETLARLTDEDIDAIRTAHGRVRTEGQAQRLLPDVEVWIDRYLTYQIVALLAVGTEVSPSNIRQGVRHVPNMKNAMLFRTLHETIEDLWTRYGNMEEQWPRLLRNLGLQDTEIYDRKMVAFNAALEQRDAG